MVARARVVIVGAGFAGLWAARRLERAPVDVLVIDRNNYHTFLPLLYQVAASELGPTSIAYPVRSILRRAANADFRMAEVEYVDLERREVHAAGERIAYDYLLLAMGSAAYFFGVEGAERHCFPLKTMDEAVPLRHHILTCLEAAAHETDADRRQAQLTFTCVGGGPTGVEFAGALAELVYGPLLRDYRAVSEDEVRIILLEAGDRLLPGMPEKLGRYARDRLERRRVRVGLDARVHRVSATELELDDGETVATETVVWSAGVTGAPGPAEWGLPMGPGGARRREPLSSGERAPRGVRRRRSRLRRAAGRGVTGRGARRHSGREQRRRQHRARARAPASQPVRLQGSRNPGSHRTV